MSDVTDLHARVLSEVDRLWRLHGIPAIEPIFEGYRAEVQRHAPEADIDLTPICGSCLDLAADVDVYPCNRLLYIACQLGIGGGT